MESHNTENIGKNVRDSPSFTSKSKIIQNVASIECFRSNNVTIR